MKKLSMDELQRIGVEEYKEANKLPLIVVLDKVRSLNNVGSVFRTADAFRVSKVVLCGITAQPPHRDIHKTALGAEDTVEWKHFDSTVDAVRSLHEDGFTVLSIEQVEGSTMLQDMKVDKTKKYAIIMGNEVKGVQQTVVNMSDGCIEIPQFGTKHSLNVSTTAGILIWEFAKRFCL
jgi:tRNA G18 (ribose-2'-O)-methylase SpoU